MNPHVILPAPDALPLPAPVWLLHFLLQLTFLLHLLAMNAMLGGLLITLWARIRSAGGDKGAGDQLGRLADSIAKVTPSFVAATVTLGVAPLLFLQTLFGQFFFTSSILMGWGWFSVVVLLIFAYYGTYLQSFRGDKLGALRMPLLAVTALLFLWVSFMFSNNTTLMLNAQQWGAMYFADAGGTHLNLGDPQLWPRWLHMLFGAVAVAGLMLALWGKARLKHGDKSGTFMVRTGVGAFTWVTLFNLLLGLWYYLAQPSEVRKLFMGGDTYPTVLFFVGFVLGIVLVLLGFFARRKAESACLVPLTLLTLVHLVDMILMRDAVRSATLGSLYRPDTFAVQPQILNLVIFAVLLVAGIGVMVWMLRALAVVWNK